MKTVEKKMVEVEVTTWKCDLCDFTTQSNKGCCGTAPIMSCWVCGKDVCRNHRHFFSENPWEDYPRGFYACDECHGEAQAAWDDAVEVAGRYDDILDVVEECIDNNRFQKDFDRTRGGCHDRVPFKWFGSKK